MNSETHEQYVEWIHDFTIPYSNNRAESSFRLQKVKMNIAGTFRSLAGAQDSGDILAMIQTLREFGLNVKEQLTNIMNEQYDFDLIQV